MWLTVKILAFGMNMWAIGIVDAAEHRLNWPAVMGALVCLWLVRIDLVENYARVEEDKDEQ